MTMGESEELDEIFPLPSPKRDDRGKKRGLIQGGELNFEDLSEDELQEMILDELESLYE
jgi:hypothetical protein